MTTKTSAETSAKAATPTPALWRNRNYLLWLGSDTGSALGIALHSFAVPLIALVATDSPAQAGIIGAAGMLGRMLATLPGGVLADRHNRRRLMMIGGMSGTVIGLGLVAAAATGNLTFWSLLALHLLMSVRNGLFGSASDAVLKDLLPETQLGSALAANQGRDAVVSLAGGPLGGILLAVSHTVALAAVAAIHAAATLLAKFMVLPAPGREADAAAAKRQEPAGRTGWVRGFAKESGEGLKWLWRRKDLRVVLLVSVIINLGTNASITSVIFALQRRGESAATIGLVSAAIGAGMLLGSMTAPALIKRVPSGVLTCGGLLLAIAALWVLPFVEQVAALCVILAVALFGAPAINAGIGGYFMTAVPSGLLGRATSASALMGMAALPLAPLIAGFGFPRLGWTGLLSFCAAIAALAGIIALANKPLRTLPGPEGWAARAAAYKQTSSV
ncbi:MFS transporter [Paeniglutamicibacter sp. NPDC091659]|uniref:MFS transporter n=1 Tax=Paeniglutamicibacter sp. NPDC091659 TaxID=3364389 RepID=UPI0038015CA4